MADVVGTAVKASAHYKRAKAVGTIIIGIILMILGIVLAVVFVSLNPIILTVLGLIAVVYGLIARRAYERFT
jgi:polyferredoxin